MSDNQGNVDQSKNNQNTGSYNPIFEKLVVEYKETEDENYLVGMLAYADYKEEKYEWIKSHPNYSEEQLQGYLDHYYDNTLNKLRDRARNFLYNYANFYAQNVLDKELDSYKEEVVKKSKTNFWKGVWEGVVASALFTAFLSVTAIAVGGLAPNTNFGKLIKYLVSTEQYEIRLIEKDSKNSN